MAKKKTTDVKTAVTAWLNRCKYAAFQRDIEKSVHGQQELRKLLANVYAYLQGISSGKMIRNNMLLTAPSGCGKTETYRALRAYFAKEIPELIISLTDLSQLTPIGFKGASAIDVLANFIIEGKNYGIAFLDEIDKKLVPQYADQGENLNSSVQSQLLTMIEGREIKTNDCVINTANILFIGLGCFDVARRAKAESAERRVIGFCQKEESPREYYDVITRNDIIKAGASYEFMGRFNCIINYGKLEYAVIDQIITEETARMEEDYGIEIELSQDIREYLHSVSNLQYGCRSISNVLTSSFLSAYPEYLQKDRSSKRTKHRRIRLISEECAEIV